MHSNDKAVQENSIQFDEKGLGVQKFAEGYIIEKFVPGAANIMGVQI